MSENQPFDSAQGKPPTAPWYQIRALANAPTAELMIFGDIGENAFSDESVTAKALVTDLAAVKGRALTVRINSYGGSVADGLAIFNALRRHAASAPVTTSVDGVAMSIASLIAMAGDTREMSANALFMVHAPWGVSIGNAVDMRATADVLDKYAQAMTSAYSRSALTEAEITALLTDGQDHFYTASEAEAAGFVTQVTADLAIAATYRENRFTRQPVAAQPIQAAAPQQPESIMTTETTKPAEPMAAAQPINVASIEAAAQAKALDAIKARAGEIRAMFKPFMSREGISALQDECLDDPSMPLDTVSAKLLTKLGEGAEPIASNPRIESGEDESDKRRAAASAALLARAGVTTGKDADTARQGNPYAHAKLYDLAHEAAVRAGFNPNGKDPMHIVKGAITQGTSDFPVILEDVMHKTLLSAYTATADTWSRFCSVGSVSDFRDWKRIYTGTISNLDTVNEMGEFKNKGIPDGNAESISIATKGNLINISRQAIINDDLSYFTRLTTMLGRAAARSIEADVYALLVANPTMDDGFALFSTDHANYQGTGGAISVATLVAAREAMRSQKDPSGNDYLDIPPSVLLCPIAKGSAARVTVNSEYDPDTASKLQRFNDARDMVSVVDTPRLSGNAWYVFADPQQEAVIEVAFLNGVRAPYLETEQGFEVDGLRYKVRLDYGVGAVGFRGAYLNAGA
jgi:ATP-dependent protease ClpP protease subunit